MADVKIKVIEFYICKWRRCSWNICWGKYSYFYVSLWYTWLACFIFSGCQCRSCGSRIPSQNVGYVKTDRKVRNKRNRIYFWTLILLVAYLPNAIWSKTPLKNGWNPGTWVLIWEYSVRAILWIPTWQGSDGFQRSLHSCAQHLKGWNTGC